VDARREENDEQAVVPDPVRPAFYTRLIPKFDL
jgi:hypothetical protein